MAIHAAGAKNNPPAREATTGATLKIEDAKLYVPIVMLSPLDNKNRSSLKTGFKETI